MKYIEYAKHIGADEHLIKWVKTTLKNAIEKKEKTTEEVEHILDYLVQADKKLERMSYEQALKLTLAWDKTQQKKGNGIEEKPEDTELLMDFKDGFKIVKLIGKNAYKREGFLMRHCVASYCGKNVEIYSLRDKDNMPHCTMEKNQQIKGKGNGDIHPKYIDYVVKFLEKIGMTVGDSEMRHLGYINLENLITELEIELSEDTKKLMYQGKYYPAHKGIEGLKDSNNEPIRTLELLDYFPMFEEEETDTGFSLKLALDIPLLAKGFIQFVKNKSSKTKEVGSGVYQNNAKVLAEDNAKVSAGNNATVSAEDYATVSAEDYAKVSAGYNAKISAGNNAKVSAGNNAKVSAGNNAKVLAEDNAKVSAGNNATVSSGNNAKVSAEDYAKISAHKHSILVAQTWSKLSGDIGTILLITKREWQGNYYVITDWKAEMVDGKKIKANTFYELKDGELVEVK